MKHVKNELGENGEPISLVLIESILLLHKTENFFWPIGPLLFYLYLLLSTLIEIKIIKLLNNVPVG